MRCMNTYFEKPSKKKATYRHMWTTGMQGPWNTDRYSEPDECLVFGRWANSIRNVESDSLTNVNSDHLALRIKMKQKLKALAEAEHGKELRGAKSEGEQQTIEYNEIIMDNIREGKAENNGGLHENLSNGCRGEANVKTPRDKEERLSSRTRAASSL